MDPEEKTPLTQIRTYQGDVAHALTDQNESIVSIQQKEIARGREQETNIETAHDEDRQKVFLLIIGTIFLLVLGTFGGWYAYKEFVRKTAPPAEITPENRFISATEEVSLDVSLSKSRTDLIKVLSEASAEFVSPNQTKNIILRLGEEASSNLLSTQDLLKTLEAEAPGSLMRAFDPLFMFGVLGGEIPSHFIIIKLVSFENAFAGMLTWEQNLAEDIGPLFATAEKLKNIPLGATFKDVTTRNKDARVLVDSEGQVVILYSFLDNNMLIITDNIETLRTLVARLTSEKLSR